MQKYHYASQLFNCNLCNFWALDTSRYVFALFMQASGCVVYSTMSAVAPPKEVCFSMLSCISLEAKFGGLHVRFLMFYFIKAAKTS
jgi:hypothetical protein